MPLPSRRYDPTLHRSGAVVPLRVPRPGSPAPPPGSPELNPPEYDDEPPPGILDGRLITGPDPIYRTLAQALGVPEPPMPPEAARRCLLARGFYLPPREVPDPLGDGWARAVTQVARSRQ